MANCAQCGTEVGEGVAFCPTCGVATMPQPPPAAPGYVAPGGYQPPPAYGAQPPPYGAQPPGYGAPAAGYGAPPPGYGAPAAGNYATWPIRVAGYAIDFCVPFVLGILGLGLRLFDVLAALVGLAFWIWWSLQVGETGQSPGMRMMGIKCISESTGQPIGAGMGIVRGIANIVNGIICYLGWLWPLWDSKHQTVADKIMTTVVITVPKQSFSITPTK